MDCISSQQPARLKIVSIAVSLRTRTPLTRPVIDGHQVVITSAKNGASGHAPNSHSVMSKNRIIARGTAHQRAITSANATLVQHIAIAITVTLRKSIAPAYPTHISAIAITKTIIPPPHTPHSSRTLPSQPQSPSGIPANAAFVKLRNHIVLLESCASTNPAFVQHIAFAIATPNVLRVETGAVVLDPS